MQLQDYIIVIPDVLDHQFCSDLINNKKYKYGPAEILVTWEGQPNQYAIPSIDTTIRNCSHTALLEEDDKVVFQAVGTAIHEYIQEVKIDLPGELTDSGYDLLKYETGGFYIQHTDDLKEVPRRVSISLLINEEYEGGEFQFFGDYKIQGETGSAIVFPSNFCYPHEVLQVESGTRYSIVTWIL